MAEEDHNYYQQMAKKPKMSSIDEKSAAEECYPRDSLDRYGDDLCEEILSYLSLADCFRFECVSKQWQRSVYKRQHNLDVNRIFHDLMVPNDMNWEAFNALMKKLPNIRSFKMSVNSLTTERILHRLTAITIPHSPSYTEAFKPLIKSCTKLTQLSTFTDNLWYRYFNLSVLFDSDNQLLAKGLTHFELSYCFAEDLPLFKAFVDHYRHSLKSINISFTGAEYSVILCALRELSNLKNLRNLFVFVDTGIGSLKSFIDCMQRLATECKLLKRFHLVMSCVNEVTMCQIYHTMDRFAQLRGLRLFFENDDQIIGDEESLSDSSTGSESDDNSKLSSIDVKSTEEECYPKDSMDRFGDDLCEEILSYLSLEDCFRFEC
ncbi:unnamed protein product, partial [Oppiella nova]